ncbi:MAG TPA: CoA transferase [Gammaproteobacteria bacterium]|nr:CoA transferase [Gammaproteobacteria bacterium]
MNDPRAAAGPRILDGVRVLDFTAVVAGPYCTRLMADLGADVLKIEPPEGELMRHTPPFRDGCSALFAQLNAGKRSLALDLKRPAAIELVQRLLAHYDVVVENFSPGVMQRFGLDYASLSALRPDLVMCSISGFGQSGPHAHKPAFAPIVHAWSGYDAVTLGYQDERTRPLNMGLPVADNLAAVQAFGAIMAALYHRARTGIGQYLDISMYDTLLASMQKDFQQMQYPEGRDRRYGPLATRDGWVLVVLLTQRQFEQLADCLERPELKTDPRYATISARFAHYALLQATIAAWCATLSTDEAVARLEEAGVPVSPYRDLSAALADPQLRRRAMLTSVVDGAGPLIVPDSPWLFSATTAAVRPSVPRLGEHADEVLATELGCDAERRAALRADGSVGPA